MSIGALDSAVSGLRMAQAQLDIISNNVSNAGTDGYTRKILPQSAQADANGITIGVVGNTITRNVDINLEKDFWTQTSQVSFLNTQASYLSQVQTFNGTPDSQTTVAAKISALGDAFNTLSNDPSNTAGQTAVVTAAATVAKKLNDFSGLLTKIRNDSQTDLTGTVADANKQLASIATFNSQIAFNQAGGKSVAALQDSRDLALKSLSQDIGVSTFIRGDGVMVVQTTNGVELANTVAKTLTFNPSALNAASGAGAAVYVGDPAKDKSAISLSKTALGGKMGALIDLRDNTAPTQQAALDEMAEQLATRTNAQGLKLFTDPNGNIPSNAGPNTATTPPTPVAYVGFAATIQVNQAIQDNNSLVQKGTAATDDPVLSGSNEVIRRVSDFAFGAVAYQQISGTTNLNTTGATDLQTLLGVTSTNRVTGTSDLSGSNSLTGIMAADPTTFSPSATPPTDQFTVTFGESRTTPALGPTTVTVSLSTAVTDYPVNGTTIKNAGDQLAAEINKQIAAAPVAAKLAATAVVNSYGELTFTSTGKITIDSSGAHSMGATGLKALGLTAGTTLTTDPYFTVQIGADPAVKITVEPGDTAATLVAKLDKTGTGDSGVDGLAVSLDPVTGRLSLRPGDSTTNPSFGGDLTITGGPFTASGTGTIAGGMPSGTTLIKALFGTDAPVTDVANPAFRTTNLGAAANISTGVTSNGSITDYSQQVVNNQAQQYKNLQAQQTDETTYATTLQKSLSDNSGVNIDEELSNMIVIQTAYSASARIITAIQSEFKDLLSAFG